MKAVSAISAGLAQSATSTSSSKTIKIAIAALGISLVLLATLSLAGHWLLTNVLSASNKIQEINGKIRLLDGDGAKQTLIDNKAFIIKEQLAQELLEPAIEKHPQSGELLPILIECGADVTVQVSSMINWSYLMLATSYSSKDNVKHILEAFTSKNIKPTKEDWQMALTAPAPILKLFLEIVGVEECQKNPIFCAHDNLEKIQLLTAYPRFRTQVNTNGETPLIFSAKNCHANQVRELLKHEECKAQKEEAIAAVKAKKQELETAYSEKKPIVCGWYHRIIDSTEFFYTHTYELRSEKYDEILEILQESAEPPETN